MVAIGDVAGAGLSATLAGVVAKSCLEVLVAGEGGLDDPERILANLNAAAATAERPILLSAFVAVLDPAARVAKYASAGHLMPYLLRSGKPRLRVLKSRGAMLGDRETSSFKNESQELSPGDTLLFHTDGVVEAADRDGRVFGERRLQRALLSSLDQKDSSPRDIVLRALDQFCGDAIADDDKALLVVRVLGA
ncbi:MAG: PP2C family protein-serine/threonine phosphatase [Pseudomonadota bacterium]